MVPRVGELVFVAHPTGTVSGAMRYERAGC